MGHYKYPQCLDAVHKVLGSDAMQMVHAKMSEGCPFQKAVRLASLPEDLRKEAESRGTLISLGNTDIDAASCAKEMEQELVLGQIDTEAPSVVQEHKDCLEQSLRWQPRTKTMVIDHRFD